MQDTAIEYSQNTKNVTPSSASNKEPLEYGELVYSVYDTNSTINYANDVFIRISKYNQQELVGKKHTVIQNSDMPKSIFSLIGEHLDKNKPVAAYLKNTANDGSHYWLMALVFPCDVGYLSVSIKPGSELFATVNHLYDRLFEHEKKVDKNPAILSSHKFLLTELKELGYSDYDEFMWNALQCEMQHRETQIEGKTGLSNVYKDHVPKELLDLESILRKLVLTLGDLRQIHSNISGHSEYILKLSRSVLLLSLNAQIGSSKLNQQDRSLSVVAEKMGEQSIAGENQLLDMQKTIFQLSELIGELNFNIISSKLQAEMTKYFITKLEKNDTESGNQFISDEKALDLLYKAFVPGIDEIADGIGKLPEILKKLLSSVRDIDRFLLALRFVHIKGKVEIARMTDESTSFSNTFQELIKEVNAAESRLNQLADIISKHEKTGQSLAGYQGELNLLGKKIKAYRNEELEEVSV